MHPECVQVCAHWAVGCGSVERSIGLSEAGRRGLWAVWLGEQTRQIIIISDTYCLVLTYHFYWYWANNNVCIIIISSPKYLNVLFLTQDSRHPWAVSKILWEYMVQTEAKFQIPGLVPVECRSGSPFLFHWLILMIESSSDLPRLFYVLVWSCVWYIACISVCAMLIINDYIWKVSKLVKNFHIRSSILG